MAEKVVAPKVQPAKVPVPPVFDSKHRQTVASMKNGRIDATYLTTLMLEHVAEYKAHMAKYGTGCPPSEELATVIWIIIQKTAGMESFIKYHDQEREDMLGRATVQCLQYIHNYDPVAAKKSKRNDPYYYISRIVSCAFVQVIKEYKKKGARLKFTSLNENILHSVTSLDQYAGVLDKSIAEERDAKIGAVGTDGSINEGIDTMEQLGL